MLCAFVSRANNKTSCTNHDYVRFAFRRTQSEEQPRVWQGVPVYAGRTRRWRVCGGTRTPRWEETKTKRGSGEGFGEELRSREQTRTWQKGEAGTRTWLATKTSCGLVPKPSSQVEDKAIGKRLWSPQSQLWFPQT